MGNDSLRAFFTFGVFWPAWVNYSTERPLWLGLSRQYAMTASIIVDITLADEYVGNSARHARVSFVS